MILKYFIFLFALSLATVPICQAQSPSASFTAPTSVTLFLTEGMPYAASWLVLNSDLATAYGRLYLVRRGYQGFVPILLAQYFTVGLGSVTFNIPPGVPYGDGFQLLLQIVDNVARVPKVREVVTHRFALIFGNV
ncbi:hypothetical protein JVU11DRAFT_9712 [Chiua virens]|nr:hypothetical protein JVU11DRAFT_9712 [Chiua virens]